MTDLDTRIAALREAVGRHRFVIDHGPNTKLLVVHEALAIIDEQRDRLVHAEALVAGLQGAAHALTAENEQLREERMPSALRTRLNKFAGKQAGTQEWSIAALRLHDLLNAKSPVNDDNGPPVMQP